MKTAVALAAVAAAFAGVAEARDQIRIVGSSTVFPFSTAVAEQFGRTTDFPTPIVESTGSGGGAKLFCAGVGVAFPDITNASRRMKKSEFDTCEANGVTSITEVQIGFDGIVFANSNDGPFGGVTTEQIFLALAKEVPVNGALVANPYERWSDIDPSLPNARIEVLGPPPTSGTRDAFEELAMIAGAEEVAFMADLAETDEDRFEEVATTLREDGAFIEAGENDNLIVQKLANNPNAFGIFGYSFVLENEDKIHAWSVNGVDVGDETVQNGSYPMARSLFFYIKNAHIGVIPGMDAYATEFVSEAAVGPDGYTVERGLIPLSPERRQANRDAVANSAPLSL
ncbi:MAG: substrate-binding domain-containing protein [Pseudomonadota bacterium]